MIKRPNDYPAGMIRYLGLADWWMSALTEAERLQIEAAFRPMGFGAGSLTVTRIDASSDTPRQYLRHLAGWVRETDSDLAERILAQSQKVPDKRVRVST